MCAKVIFESFFILGVDIEKKASSGILDGDFYMRCPWELQHLYDLRMKQAI